MSITYNPTTNFGSKDVLPANDPNKVIVGAEFTSEFNAIQAAFALAAPTSNPTFSGTATYNDLTVTGFLNAGTTTVGTFTSTGIDDNATSTAITIDANENVGVGNANPTSKVTVGDGTTSAAIQFPCATKNNFVGYDGSFDGLQLASNGEIKFQAGVGYTQRMLIDAQGNVGIGTDPQEKLDVNGVASFNGIKVGGNGTDINSTFLGANSLLTFRNNGVEHMRIDPLGRVGMGNDAPSTYTGAGAPSLVIGDHTGFEGVTLASSTSTTGNIAFSDSAGGSSQYRGLLRYDHADDSMQMWTNSVRRMTITAAGNVGIGTNVPSTSLDIIRNGVQPLRLESTSGNKVSIRLANTGGNAFVEAVDANIVIPSGNVGIGETNPDQRLHVTGTTSNYGILAEQPSGYGGLSVKSTTSAQTWSFIASDNGANSDLLLYGGSSAGTKVAVSAAGKVGIGTDAPASTLDVATTAEVPNNNTFKGVLVGQDSGTMSLGTGVGIGFKMRNTAGGNLGGNSAGAAIYGVQSATGVNQGVLTFHTRQDSTSLPEAMRIDASGNLLVGTTSAIGTAENAKTGVTVYKGGAIANCRDSALPNVFLSKTGQLNGEYLQFARDGADIGNINYNGSSLNLTTASDERLKKNIVPAQSALDVIKGIEVVSHDWTDDSKAHVEWGVLAQQVNDILPSAVTEGAEDVNDKPWMISRDSFVIPLLKAMQEQQAMIEALTAKVEALENA